MSVKIAAQFTGEARSMNGLDNIVEELLEDPKARRLLVAEYYVTRRTIEDDEGGVYVPTVKLDQIEPVLDADDEKAIRAILQRAYAKRATPDDGQPSLLDDGDED